MYHIKNDRRAEKSVELIIGALTALMGEKAFAEITVTDLQRRSTVSRSTFYRNFDSLTDVLALLCDRGFQAIFSGGDEQDLRSEVFNYWFCNSAVLEVLVSIHRTDIFLLSFRREAMKLESLRFLAQDPCRCDYFISIITSVMVGVLTTWIEHGKKETREQVANILTDEFAAISALGIAR